MIHYFALLTIFDSLAHRGMWGLTMAEMISYIPMVLVCLFPTLIVAALSIILPVRVPERMNPFHDVSATARNTSPISTRERLTFQVLFLLVSLFLAVPLGIVQHQNFKRAGSDGSFFSIRASDDPAHSGCVAIFICLIVGYPICLKLLHLYMGDKLLDLLDRPTERLTLRQEIRQYPWLAWGIVIPVTLMNFLAFNAFYQVSGSEFRYSTFFSLSIHHHPLANVRDLVIYSKRKAPNGKIRHRRYLVVRLKDGSAIDTFYVIEPEQIPQMVTAFTSNPAFKGSVISLDREK